MKLVKKMKVKSGSLQDYIAQKLKVINDLTIPGPQSDISDKYVRDMPTKLGGLPAWRIEP